MTFTRWLRCERLSSREPNELPPILTRFEVPCFNLNNREDSRGEIHVVPPQPSIKSPKRAGGGCLSSIQYPPQNTVNFYWKMLLGHHCPLYTCTVFRSYPILFGFVVLVKNVRVVRQSFFFHSNRFARSFYGWYKGPTCLLLVFIERSLTMHPFRDGTPSLLLLETTATFGRYFIPYIDCTKSFRISCPVPDSPTVSTTIS